MREVKEMIFNICAILANKEESDFRIYKSMLRTIDINDEAQLERFFRTCVNTSGTRNDKSLLELLESGACGCYSFSGLKRFLRAVKQVTQQ
jgi:hypothetical protein